MHFHFINLYHVFNPTPLLFLFIVFLLFYPLERATAITRPRKMDAGYFLDMQYALTVLLLGPVAYDIFLHTGLPWPGVKQTAPEHIEAAARHLPFMLGFPLTLFIYDAVNSVRHRFFHMRVLWDVHSIHHSATDVNWITGLRFHPAEIVITASLRIVTLSLLYVTGIASAGTLITAGLFISLYDAFFHCNCRWTFGPLKRVLVSPVYHRWHHSPDAAAIDKNFASIFPVIDMIMGTYYMPDDKQPLTSGLNRGQETYPESLWGQIIHPFRRTKTDYIL